MGAQIATNMDDDHDHGDLDGLDEIRSVLGMRTVFFFDDGFSMMDEDENGDGEKWDEMRCRMMSKFSRVLGCASCECFVGSRQPPHAAAAGRRRLTVTD